MEENKEVEEEMEKELSGKPEGEPDDIVSEALEEEQAEEVEEETEETPEETAEQKEPEGMLQKGSDGKVYKKPYEQMERAYITATKFKSLVKFLSDFEKEDITFDLTENGLEIKAVDDAHTSMFIMNMDYSHDMFKDMKIPFPFKMTVNIPTLDKILKAFSHDVVLEIEPTRLIVKDSSKLYRTSFIAYEYPPKIPNLEDKLTAEIEITVSKLNELVRNADRITDNIRLNAKDNTVLVTAESETTDFEAKLTPSNGLENIGEGKGLYPIDQLKQMSRAGDFADKVIMKWGNDYPLMLKYPIKDGYGENARECGELKFLLAPRIESD